MVSSRICKDRKILSIAWRLFRCDDDFVLSYHIVIICYDIIYIRLTEIVVVFKINGTQSIVIFFDIFFQRNGIGNAAE